eukprot:NODE_283_length_10814_cov_0.705460.p1 type:complete len:500 gc:universal NODE_283_length_10814_cov_0.705460:1561-62(-)
MSSTYLTRPFKRSACEHLEYLKNSSWHEVNAALYYAEHIKLVYQNTIKNSKAVKPARCPNCKSFTKIHINLAEPNYFCIRCIQMATALNGTNIYISIDHMELYCSICKDYIYDDEVYYLLRYYETLLLKNELPENAEIRFIIPRGYVENEKILIDKYSKPAACTGMRGILNLGNTCYLNVIVQTLIYNPIIQDYFLKGNHEFHSLDYSNEEGGELAHLNDYCIACDLDELFKENLNPHALSPLCPTNLLYHSWILFKDLAGHSQQDSHEYFMHLLNALHDALSPNSKSARCRCIVHYAFGATLESVVRCTACNSKSLRSDPVLDISLDIRMSTSRYNLLMCLDHFFGEEVLHQFTCSNCGGNKDAKRRLNFGVLPNILAIQLKRFEVVSTGNPTNNRHKIDNQIIFPLDLNMSKYSKDANSYYELFSVVMHRGKLDSYIVIYLEVIIRCTQSQTNVGFILMTTRSIVSQLRMYLTQKLIYFSILEKLFNEFISILTTFP